MTRGRLIRPFIAEIARLDTAATETADGYDHTFRTVKASFTPDGTRTSARKEMVPIRLKAQVEPGTFETQRQVSSGNSPDTRIELIFHFSELTEKKLVDKATGRPLLQVNDRLVALYQICGSKLVLAMPMPRAAYATEVRPIGFGLGGGRNLLHIIFEDRPQGLVGSPG